LTGERSTLAVAAGWLGIAAALSVTVGVLGARFGILSPLLGFRLFGLGALPLALLSLVLGLIGLLRTSPASGRSGRGQAFLGTGIGMALLALVVVTAAPTSNLPVINDISTDPEDPPVYRAAVRELGEALPYPGEEFAAMQRAAYPDIVSLEIDAPPDQVFDRAREIALGLGFEIVAEHRDAGILEAQDVSSMFRFVDDVVVRIRPRPGGSVLDVRSRSRVGQGDLGANAERIRKLQQAMR
jgi:uncharacterized protein (DUF1499 family)